MIASQGGARALDVIYRRLKTKSDGQGKPEYRLPLGKLPLAFACLWGTARIRLLACVCRAALTPGARAVFPASVLLPLGLLLYGWGAERHLHWIMPGQSGRTWLRRPLDAGSPYLRCRHRPLPDRSLDDSDLPSINKLYDVRFQPETEGEPARLRFATAATPSRCMRRLRWPRRSASGLRAVSLSLWYVASRCCSCIWCLTVFRFSENSLRPTVRASGA